MNTATPTGFGQIAQQTALYPQEQPAPVADDRKRLLIGLPRETALQDRRIALTPEGVALLSRNGHEVLMEAGAGEGSHFSDHEYAEAGARVVHSPQEAFAADIVLKIEPVHASEIEHLRPGSTLISALTLPNLNQDYFRALNKKKITGIGFEYIEDKGGGRPIIRAMSEIAGSTVMLIAAEYLSSVQQGRGVMLGGITGVPPTRVVILGAGTVAEFAARTALGLGVELKVFDRDTYRLQRLRYALGQPIATAIIDSDTLPRAIAEADVVVGAVRSKQGRSPLIVTDALVAAMKPNAVIIDVSIDQGGNFETSEMTSLQKPVYHRHGVIHYCVPNIPSRVARTASTALSNVFAPFLLQTGQLGGIEAMIFANRWFMRGIYCHNGSVTNADIARMFDLRYKDLGLLMAARF